MARGEGGQDKGKAKGKPKLTTKQKQDKKKEKEKLWARLKDQNFPPQVPENPTTTRDRMIKQIWCELKGLPIPQYDEVYEGPIEPRIEELKKKTREFEEKVRKQKEQWEKEQAEKASNGE